MLEAVSTLVIDDDPFQLQLIAHQLRSLGLRHITTCDTARDALAVMEQNPAAGQLVICDLQMPEMDGVQFMRHLAHIGYEGRLLLLSGEDHRILHSAEQMARQHGLNILGALVKPVDSGRLQQLLELSIPPRSSRPAVRPYTAEDLRHAISAGHLVNHYQPKVQLDSGKISGVEALVRWQHPNDGLIFPDSFITLAEEHELIDDLTEAVLAKALDDSKSWQAQGLELRVAINISMDNLSNLEFPDSLSQSAAQAGVPLSRLILEVTESRLMRTPSASLDILTRLRLKRIDLSIDDFGTGHSSLAQLRDIPFNELKVDRGFTHGACRDPSRRAILEASLNMAHKLDIKSVAEGVEDLDDWLLLRELQCDLAQGYFIARPMPADALPEWAEAWERRRGSLTDC